MVKSCSVKNIEYIMLKLAHYVKIKTMKANNGNGNNILRDNWTTPLDLFHVLNMQYGFYFDCCANFQNTLCDKYSFDFLLHRNRIITTAWINPPFSKAYIMFEHFFKIVNQGVGIYRCDNMETKIWQEVIFKNADWIFIPNKRIKYIGFNCSGLRFPSALIGLRVDSPKNISGTLIEAKQ